MWSRSSELGDSYQRPRISWPTSGRRSRIGYPNLRASTGYDYTRTRPSSPITTEEDPDHEPGRTMKEDRADARPVPVPPAVRELIREHAPEREDAPPLERRFSRGRGVWVATIVGEHSAGSGRGVPAHLAP